MSKPVSECSCGRLFFHVPENARVLNEGDLLDGFYFECECGSTQFVPIKPAQEMAA